MSDTPPPLNGVLNAIARAVLGDRDPSAPTIGAITLRDHQLDALRRVRASIREVGGALLSDEPGLGKTYVALALAREHPATIVVAPAALRAMWRSAVELAGVDTSFVSMEALSRRGSRIDAHAARRDALVIVDEAHHAANPATARYARLARLVAYRPVLLLSATPVRNRRAEQSALLALFFGSRAQGIDDATRARCVIRRAGDPALRPSTDGPHWHRIRASTEVGRAIAALPPPLPALDGAEAGALLRISLARCWASSLAALDAALLRRLQRGAALGAALEAGRLPTRSELRAWVGGDDAVQLAFPMFVSREVRDTAPLRAALDAHIAAVRALRAGVAGTVIRDASRRAQLLLGLRRRHHGARVVAFTAHAATAMALFRALRNEAGVALLTARGARSAGGARPRGDVIAALAGADDPGGRRSPPAHDQISLVIATDLLSEGVNLQGASVVVHLDVPWTPAGLDQRVGRAARMGSAHERVHVHGFAVPRAAQRLLALDRRLARKRSAQDEAARAPNTVEQLREVVRQWRRELPDAQPEHDVVIATARGPRDGFLAVIDTAGSETLVSGVRHGKQRWNVSDAPTDVFAVAAGVQPRAAVHDAALAASAHAALDRWLSRRVAQSRSGAEHAPSWARRALLARLDAALRAVQAHNRAALAPRLARARELVDDSVSAGAEDVLAELGRLETDGLDELLTACEGRLAAAPSRSGRIAGAAPAVRALLLLRRDP